jgi:hypothetical protein
MYYLAPTLVSTRQISDDIHDLGIEDWHVHVISKDETGLKNDKIHSSNWLETRDLLRDGFIGANIGLIVGVLGAGVLLLFKPFGPNFPVIANIFLVVVATLFGAWVGGLIGIDSENQKLKRFHDDIEAGKYLILIYARKGMGEKIKEMMRKLHPESRHIATDLHFFNPFAQVERRQRGSQPSQVNEN